MGPVRRGSSLEPHRGSIFDDGNKAMPRSDVDANHWPALRTPAVALIGTGCGAAALAFAAPSIGLGSSETFFFYVHFGISRGNLAMLGAFACSIGAVAASGIVRYWPIDSHAKAKAAKPGLAVRASYLAGCAIVCFVALEIALRLYFRVPVFALRDLRGQLQQSQTLGYDPLLGWSARPNFVSGEFGTLDYGIRKNSDRDEQLTPGAVLAVGDSFTEGAEVVNEDTWPAQLERTLGVRVINAGIGAYGVDQAILNAERLLPILKPRAVLVGIYEHDILRVGYRSYGAPKPYFEQENGVWVHRNSPVPQAPVVSEPWYKRILARSMVIHVFMGRYFARYWYSFMRFERAFNDPVKTTCYALERLQKTLAQQNIPALIVIQYGGGIYSLGSPRPAHVDEVLRCGHDLGFSIVDEFDRLSAVARVALSDLKQHYMMRGGVYRHMSARGNALIASLIAEKLRTVVDLRTLAPLSDAIDPGDGSVSTRTLPTRLR